MLKSISDNLTEKYFSRLKSGEFLPINATEICEWERGITTVHLSGSASIGGSSYVLTGTQNPVTWITHTDWSPGTDSAKVDLAVIQALASAKEPEFDILTFLAEFPKTVDLIRYRFGSIMSMAEKLWRKALRDLRRGRRGRKPRRRRDPGPDGDNGYVSRSSLRRVWKRFNKLWLEARYGWRPLVYDVENALAALAHKEKVGVQKQTSHVTVEDADDPVVTETIVSSTQKWVTSRVRSYEQTYRAKVFYRSTAGPIGANPVITAWELTRFSFILDWFIDIGSWLQAISPRFGYESLGTSVSVTGIERVSYETEAVGSGAWANLSGEGAVVYVRRRYQRWAYSGIPLPRFNIRLNPAKLTDLVALISNAVMGFGSPAGARF